MVTSVSVGRGYWRSGIIVRREAESTRGIVKIRIILPHELKSSGIVFPQACNKDAERGHNLFAATPPLELLNMPRDADALAEARRRLVDAGFWVSRTLSPQDLAFEDLLEAATRAPLV